MKRMRAPININANETTSDLDLAPRLCFEPDDGGRLNRGNRALADEALKGFVAHLAIKIIAVADDLPRHFSLHRFVMPTLRARDKRADFFV